MQQRKVRLFRNGRNQAVRIPRAMALSGTEALIRKQGDRLIIEPIVPEHSILDVLAGLPPLDEADRLDDIEDQPPEPVEF